MDKRKAMEDGKEEDERKERKKRQGTVFSLPCRENKKRSGS
jgi:predicted RNase H-like nuclease